MAANLSTSGAARVIAFWAGEMCCQPDQLFADSVSIRRCQLSPGREYVHLLRRQGRLQIACSDSLFDLMQDAIAGQHLSAVFDPDFLARALGRRVERIVGPTFLGYSDLQSSGTNDPNVRSISASDAGDLDQLRDGVSSRDWEYSGIEADQPLAGYFVDGRLVSAAGYEVWGQCIAHIGVATHRSYRGHGYARACVRYIADRAIERGLIAQYQTLLENHSAIAVAQALGFEEYGQRLFVRATAT